jgi:biopolymer transport protein ExbD
MAGVSVQDVKKEARRPLDSEVNLIPMIDLLICCTAFLLITAVWMRMSRVDASAQVPGKEAGPVPTAPDKALHVAVSDPDKFSLVWKQGSTVINTVDVPRRAVVVDEHGARTIRYPDLAAAIQREWTLNGSHRDASDGRLDQAVLHAGDTVPYRDLVAVMDAIRAPKRHGAGSHGVPAFRISFATD